jgi:hypothetical protein
VNNFEGGFLSPLDRLRAYRTVSIEVLEIIKKQPPIALWDSEMDEKKKVASRYNEIM